jgi:hypothetical protein
VDRRVLRSPNDLELFKPTEAEGNGAGFYGKPYQPGSIVKNDRNNLSETTIPAPSLYALAPVLDIENRDSLVYARDIFLRWVGQSI